MSCSVVPMTPTERTRGTHVELFGRDSLPKPASGRRERIEGRLADLSSAGVIAAFDGDTWPKRVPCDGSAEASIRDRYLAFTAWAERNGVRLTPFFGTRECYCMETGERGEWLVLPALCLAVYEDGDLTAVFPHADGDTYRSVASGLRFLERATDPHGADSTPASHAD